jgi:NitT/TauT family transport system substrate-binding protein
MKRTRLLIVGSVIFVGLVLAVSAEGAREREADLELSIGTLKGPSGIGMIRLVEDAPVLAGYAETRFQVVPNPNLMISRILAGEVDAAVLPTNMAAILYARGAPYQFAAVTGYGVLYLLSSGPEIRSVADLEGRRLSVIGRGATPDFVVRYLLSRHGLEPGDDVELDFTYGHLELAQLLIAGRVDLAVMPEPFVTQVTTANPDVRVELDLQRLWSSVQGMDASYPMTCLVIKREIAENHPSVLRALLVEYERSINWARANPGEAGALAAKHALGMPAGVAEAALPRLNLTFISAGEARELVDDYLSILHAFSPKAVGGSLPDEAFYVEE